jgi:hypothetical protein
MRKIKENTTITHPSQHIQYLGYHVDQEMYADREREDLYHDKK